MKRQPRARIDVETGKPIYRAVKGTGKVFSSTDEVRIAFDAGEVDMQAKIRVRMKNLVSDESVQLIETTAGRVVLSEILPDTVPFQCCQQGYEQKGTLQPC